MPVIFLSEMTPPKAEIPSNNSKESTPYGRNASYASVRNDTSKGRNTKHNFFPQHSHGRNAKLSCVRNDFLYSRGRNAKLSCVRNDFLYCRGRNANYASSEMTPPRQKSPHSLSEMTYIARRAVQICDVRGGDREAITSVIPAAPTTTKTILRRRWWTLSIFFILVGPGAF